MRAQDDMSFPELDAYLGQERAIEWVGPRPEDRRQQRDYCKHCGIARGVDVLNYQGRCRHEFETVTFVPESKP
jgi:hypothetical protein